MEVTTMEITEVRVKLVEKPGERLRAFCSVTLDGDFVIRDLKIIDGANGAFVAMPSRKLADRCPKCGCKNHLRARFCNDCGSKLDENRAPKDSQGRAKLHADVAHPINVQCRERIQKAVTEAYHAELEKSKSPDYKPPKIDDFEDDFAEAVPPAAGKPSEQKAVAQEQPAESKQSEGSFSDYDSLIEDLKREAEGRRGQRDSSPSRDTDVYQPKPLQKDIRSPNPSGIEEKPLSQSQPSDDRRDSSNLEPQTESSSNDDTLKAMPEASPSSAPAGQSSPTSNPPRKNDDFGAGLL
jgi:stage V sporulation protein G